MAGIDGSIVYIESLMRRMTPARFPETLAFLMRRRALSRLGGIGAMAFSQKIRARNMTHPHQRIICVGGALTEITFELGAQSFLVGVDSTSTFPKEALGIAKVGYARSLSPEGILALAPTQVIVTEEAGPAGVLRQVTEAGVPVEVLDSAYRYEGLIKRVARMGRLLGHETEAVMLTERLNREWGQIVVSGHASTLKQPRVLFLFAHSASRLMVAGAKTGAQSMIEYAGALNAMKGFDGYKTLTPEALVLARPDILLLTEQGYHALGDEATVLNLPGMRQTPAGKAARIITMEASLLLGFGPRLPVAVQRLQSQFIGATAK